MGIAMYTADEMNSEKAQKMVVKLKRENIIPDNRNVELLYGGFRLTSRFWGLICTDKEMIIFNYRKAGLFPKGTKYPYSSITGHYAETNGYLSKMYIYLGGEEKVPLGFTLTDKWANAIDEYLTRKLKKEENNLQQAQANVNTISKADELKKLAELRDSQILTEEEFQAEKAKILKA